MTHMGPTVGCGHYTAVAQAPSGNFYQFDDSMVRPISHQTVFNTNAYIMLYELETAPPKPATVTTNKSKASSTVTENTLSLMKPIPNGFRGKTSPLGCGFTSDKVYGPELPPIRANASSSVTNKSQAVSSTSVRAALTVPELTDDSSGSESSETEAKKAPSPEPDSSTNEQSVTPTKKSPEASPSSAVSSLSSPEADTSKMAASPSKSLVPYETGDTSGSDDSNHSDRDGRNRLVIGSLQRYKKQSHVSFRI